MKLGWMSTGRGEGSKKLLLATLENIKTGYIDAQIEFVFCNRVFGEQQGSDQFLSVVESNSIPVVAYSSRQFAKHKRAKSFSDIRVDYDRDVVEMLAGFNYRHILVGKGIQQRVAIMSQCPRVNNDASGCYGRFLYVVN